MAFRGRGRGRGAPPPRHDIQLPEHEQVSDVPVTFPKIPDKHVPIRAKDVQLGAQQQRVLVCFPVCLHDVAAQHHAVGHANQQFCRCGSPRCGLGTVEALSF